MKPLCLCAEEASLELLCAVSLPEEERGHFSPRFLLSAHGCWAVWPTVLSKLNSAWLECAVKMEPGQAGWRQGSHCCQPILLSTVAWLGGWRSPFRFKSWLQCSPQGTHQVLTGCLGAFPCPVSRMLFLGSALHGPNVTAPCAGGSCCGAVNKHLVFEQCCSGTCWAAAC